MSVEDSNELVEYAIDESMFSGKLLDQYRQLDLSLLDLPVKALEDRANPTLAMVRMKKALWQGVENWEKTGEQISPMNIYGGICTYGSFNRVMTDPHKLAWMLQPMVRYEDEMDAVLNLAAGRYEEMIKMPITVIKKKKNSDGEMVEYEDIDPARVRTLLAVINQAENRAKGLALQKTLNIHSEKPKGTIKELDMRKIDERMAELEAKLGKGDNDDDIECTEAILVEIEGSDAGQDS